MISTAVKAGAGAAFAESCCCSSSSLRTGGSPRRISWLRIRATNSNGTKSYAKEISSSSSASLEGPQLALQEPLLELQVVATQHMKVLVTEGESRAKSSFLTSAPVARSLVSKEVYRHQVVSFRLLRP